MKVFMHDLAVALVYIGVGAIWSPILDLRVTKPADPAVVSGDADTLKMPAFPGDKSPTAGKEETKCVCPNSNAKGAH